MRRVVDDLGDIAFVVLVRDGARPVDAEIAGRFREKLGVALHHGVVQIDYRRQFLVLNDHQIGRVLRGRCGFRHHHGHRVAAMHHLVAGKRRAERHRHLGAAAADHRRMPRHAADAGRLHVLGGQHREHFLGCARRVAADRQDAGMGMRRAHEGGIGLVRQARVVHEAAAAAHQGVVLDARFVLGACGLVVVMGGP